MKSAGFNFSSLDRFALSLGSPRFPEVGRSEISRILFPGIFPFHSETGVDTEVPNMVTAVLADYRGFDTMLETVVVFIAGLAVFSILKEVPNKEREIVSLWSNLSPILLSPTQFA